MFNKYHQLDYFSDLHELRLVEVLLSSIEEIFVLVNFLKIADIFMLKTLKFKDHYFGNLHLKKKKPFSSNHVQHLQLFEDLWS